VILEHKFYILTNETQFKFRRYFKFNNKKNDKLLVQNSSPKAETCISFLMLLWCDSHIRQ